MKNAVVAPITSTNDSATSEYSNSGDMRATMKMPAVTMVAAWIRAEIGVGPSMESGSHTCSGTCADLPMAPMNRQMQMSVSASTPPSPTAATPARDLRSRGEGLADSRGCRCSRRRPRCRAGIRSPRSRLTRNALRRCEGRRRARVPEADQQIGDAADRFPAEEQLHEVVRHHEHQHREREQRDVAEEALVARVIGHVADGVDVHAQRHERDHGHHERGQPVDQEAHLDMHAVAHEPGVDRAVECGHVVPVHLLQHVERKRAGERPPPQSSRYARPRARSGARKCPRARRR